MISQAPWMVNNIFTLYSWDYPIKLPNGFLYSVEVRMNYFTGGYKGFSERHCERNRHKPVATRSGL